MQRQNELEMATNRISSAISSTLEIEHILQSLLRRSDEPSERAEPPLFFGKRILVCRRA
jgi:hypothetical protein